MAETYHDHAALMEPPIAKETARTRKALVLILAARLILSIAFSLATPLGEAPDEADHYAYAAYILEKGELPIGTEMTQGKHPPLYHILSAAAGKLVGGSPDRSFLRANPDMAFGPQSQATNFFIHTTVENWPWREGVLTMAAGRLVSILAGLVLVIATYLLGRAIWLARPELALAGAAFTAFLPESLFVSGAMSNDMLAAMWSTLALWLALRGVRSQPQATASSHDRPAINRRASEQRPLKGAYHPLTGSPSPLERALPGSPATLAPGGGRAARGSPLHEQFLNVHKRKAIISAVLTGVCLGLAFVTKASTGSLAAIVTAVFLVSAWQDAPRHPEPRGDPGKHAESVRRSPWVQSKAGPRLWPGLRALAPGLVQVALAGAAAFLIAAPWLWRNWRLYGDPFGWPVVLATIDQRQGPLGLADVMQLLSGWWLSFWGKFGGAGHVPLPAALYVIWAAICAGALAGWILRLAGKARESYCEWIILLGAPLVTAAGIYSYSKVALGTDQGRLLFPALGPLALLVAGGLSGWFPRRARDGAVARQTALWTGLFAGGMALVAITSLLTGLVRPFAAPPAPQPERIAAAQAVNATFGSLELVATAWDDPAPGQLTLYWRAAQRTTDDLRTALRLFDANGNLLWEWKRSPGAGRLSTDWWLPGRIVADTYRLPQEALSQAVRAEVGVRPFPEGPWIPAAGLAADQLLAIPR